MLGTVYTVDSILPYLASSSLPALFGDASADFSCCFWVSCYCTLQAQPQSLPLGFSPVLHPGLCAGSSEMLPSSPLPAACFPVISSPNTHSQIPTQPPTPFPFFYLTANLYCISAIEIPLSSLPFSVEPAIISSFLSLFLFLLTWRWTPPSTPFYFNEKALGEVRCVNLCSGPKQARNTCYKET